MPVRKNRYHPHTPIVLGTILAFTLLVSCDYERRESITTSFEQYYLIEPSSLLVLIKQGKGDSFKPVSFEPELPPPSEQVPVDWRQTDYLSVVEALYRDIWSDSLEDWSLKSVSFALGCTEVDNGFQNAHFRYYQNMNLKNVAFRLERSIQIDPRSNSVYLLEFEYSPRLVEWGSIDLTRFQFSADDALAIAERNGGQQYRVSAENNCDIDVLLTPDSPGYHGWDVRYFNYTDGTIFQVQIDPLTGKVYVN
jgi:hypothetical protein